MKPQPPPKKQASFTAFVRALNITLTAAQLVLALVAFDFAAVSALATAAMRALAERLFGAIDVVPQLARSVVGIVAGRFSGKTWLGMLRCVHLALTVPLRLAPGEQAYAIVVAPDMRLASHALRFGLGVIQAHPALAKRLRAVKAESFQLVRDDGQVVTFEALPATEQGSALRGRTIVAALLDECCFFYSGDGYTVTDAGIFDAIEPRLAVGGQILLISTPAGPSGLLHELWKENFGAPKTAIVAHAPTELMREDADTHTKVARSRQRKPENAKQEFDALFLAAGSGLFFPPEPLDASVDGLPRPIPRGRDDQAFAAIDLGLVRDSSTCVIVLASRGVYTVADTLEVRPEPGAPLQPSVVVARFAEMCERYNVSSVVADLHYAESVREHLARYGLELRPCPPGQEGKARTYVAARALIAEGRVHLPDDPRLLGQLRAVRSRPTPGGALSITSPRRKGSGHGDLASAAVLALFAASAGSRPSSVPTVTATIVSPGGRPAGRAGAELVDDDGDDLCPPGCVPLGEREW